MQDETATADMQVSLVHARRPLHLHGRADSRAHCCKHLEGINILALEMDGSELAPAGVVGPPSHAAKTLLEADGFPWCACMPCQCRGSGPASIECVQARSVMSIIT